MHLWTTFILLPIWISQKSEQMVLQLVCKNILNAGARDYVSEKNIIPVCCLFLGINTVQLGNRLSDALTQSNLNSLDLPSGGAVDLLTALLYFMWFGCMHFLRVLHWFLVDTASLLATITWEQFSWKKILHCMYISFLVSLLLLFAPLDHHINSLLSSYHSHFCVRANQGSFSEQDNIKKVYTVVSQGWLCADITEVKWDPIRLRAMLLHSKQLL